MLPAGAKLLKKIRTDAIMERVRATEAKLECEKLKVENIRLKRELASVQDPNSEVSCCQCETEFPLSEMEKCEGDERLLCADCVRHDIEGTPLCQGCFAELVEGLSNA